MKAFLLCAGVGTRLRPLTETIPKCLVPIDGRPLLEIWLEHLHRHGVDEVLVNSHHHAGRVERFVREGERIRRSEVEKVRSLVGGGSEGWPAVELFYEETLLGSGGTVYQRRDFVEGDDLFWVIYGDNLSLVNLTEMRSQVLHPDTLGVIGLFHSNRPEQCGIAEMDEGGRVDAFEEKPQNPKGDLANAGVYLLKREVFDNVRWDFTPPVDFGYHILPQLIGHVYGYVIGDYHLDIGTPENYARAQKEFALRVDEDSSREDSKE